MDLLPEPAQWALAFAGLLAGGSLVGWLARVGAGTGIFLAGAVPILWSLTYIRLGGPRTRVGRANDGRPVWGVDQAARGAEIRRGAAVFGLGVALWATLAIGYVAGVIV